MDEAVCCCPVGWMPRSRWRWRPTMVSNVTRCWWTTDGAITLPPAPVTRRFICILMGFGGVTAMGCTIGQGITGVSTLALGSILVFFSIIAGAAVTMKIQYRRMRKAG